MSDSNLPAEPASHRVVILGASPKPERYANQAQRLLMEGGYDVVPVHPTEQAIEGVAVLPNPGAVPPPVHTLTLYVGPQRSSAMVDDILGLQAQRVIFNPGTESDELEERLRAQGAECVHGCTLVMLRSGQF